MYLYIRSGNHCRSRADPERETRHAGQPDISRLDTFVFEQLPIHEQPIEKDVYASVAHVIL
jgi:hypothetical protein